MKRLAEILCIGVVGLTTITSVKAQTIADLKWIGEEQQYINDTFNLTIALNNNNGSIVTIGGNVKVEDTNCIKLDSIKPLISGTDYENDKFIYMNMHGLENDNSLFNVTFKTGNNACQTNIKLENATLYFTDDTAIRNIIDTKQITVLEESITNIEEEKEIEEIEEIEEEKALENEDIDIVLPTSNKVNSSDKVVVSKNILKEETTDDTISLNEEVISSEEEKELSIINKEPKKSLLENICLFFKNLFKKL